MKIAFHGAARTVTGSKHLLTLANNTKILLDCGLFQGMGQDTNSLNAQFGFVPSEIDYLILSHAHIDHSGLIPKLVREGFKGKIFCTQPTSSLAAVLLEDSAVIQRDDTRFVNKRRALTGLPPVVPLYTEEDVKATLHLFVPEEYDQWFNVCDGVKAMFTDAGHIIGSAVVNLSIKENGKETHLTFTGDVGRYRDVILKSPEPFPQADYIISESTYGNSLHDQIADTLKNLEYWIEETCVRKKGKLVIPAFSVGRTQELLYYMNQLFLEKKLPHVKVFVDSPLSEKVTKIVKSYSKYFNSRIHKLMETDVDPFDFTGLTFTADAEESKAINSLNQPCIILAASGMADAGRIKHHIANTINDKRNTILIVGYCEPFSLGGKLMRGAKKVRIYGEEHHVIAEVGVMRSLSAHGDYDDLSQFLSCQDAKKVNKFFIVHGEYDVQQNFQERLFKKGFQDVVIPKLHEEFGLG